MPLRAIRVRGAVVLAFALLLIPASARAASKPVDLRVLTSQGKTLADFRQYTEDVTLHSSHKAKCFGPDNPSTDHRYDVKGASLLGVLADAAEHRSALRPLVLNNTFADDGFGLGVCRIGEFKTIYAAFPETAPYWYGAVNGVGASTGPDLVPLARGDEALWYYTNGEESGFPNELVLQAPARAMPGVPFNVKVRSIAPDGTVSPAAGVVVEEASAETDAEGKTQVTLESSRSIRATGGIDDVPSARLRVCVDANPFGCPVSRGLTIFGSGRHDKVKGTKGNDTIDARSGNDLVDISSGGDDEVSCGGGDDKVVGVKAGDHVSPSCEVTKH